MSKSKSIINQSAEKISDNYSENPLTAILLTALSIAIPQVAIGKEAIDRAVTKIQKERFATLLDELAKGEKLLTPEIIETEEFIHSFVIVYRAAINTYQREKIRCFARILLTAIERDELAGDKFEMFTQFCERLSNTELAILKIMLEQENNFVESSRENKQEIVAKPEVFAEYIWSDFLANINTLLLLDEENLRPYIFRVESYGLYQTSEGNTIIGSRRGIQGITTKIFKEFVAWIEQETDTEPNS